MLTLIFLPYGHYVAGAMVLHLHPRQKLAMPIALDQESRSLPRTPRRLPLGSHWPEWGHMSTLSCKGAWEMGLDMFCPSWSIAWASCSAAETLCRFDPGRMGLEVFWWQRHTFCMTSLHLHWGPLFLDRYECLLHQRVAGLSASFHVKKETSPKVTLVTTCSLCGISKETCQAGKLSGCWETSQPLWLPNQLTH